jgi:hypothetical protein
MSLEEKHTSKPTSAQVQHYFNPAKLSCIACSKENGTKSMENPAVVEGGMDCRIPSMRDRPRDPHPSAYTLSPTGCLSAYQVIWLVLTANPTMNHRSFPVSETYPSDYWEQGALHSFSHP